MTDTLLGYSRKITYLKDKSLIMRELTKSNTFVMLFCLRPMDDL